MDPYVIKLRAHIDASMNAYVQSRGIMEQEELRAVKRRLEQSAIINQMLGDINGLIQSVG
jgi:hypothetical protein